MQYLRRSMRADCISNHKTCWFLFLMGALSPQLSLARRSLRGDGAGVNDPSYNSPKLLDCLLSGSDSVDCGTVVAGCKWCAEPVYGLCVTEKVSGKISWMPFFTCDMDGVSVQ